MSTLRAHDDVEPVHQMRRHVDVVTKKKRPKTFKTEKQRSVEALDPRRNLPLNRYNLYCILERQRLVQSNPDYRPSENEGKLPGDIYTGYEGMQLPQLPPRYQHLVIADDW